MRRSRSSIRLIVATALLWAAAGLGVALGIGRGGPEAPVRRAVHGVVLTTIGDPLPGVSIASAHCPPTESNAWGEFCLFLERPSRALLTATRKGFEPATVDVPAGAGDFETLLVLASPAPQELCGARRFFVLDALSRAAPDLDVAVHASASGKELFRGRSGADGAVSWVAPAETDAFYDLCVRSSAAGESWVRGLPLHPDDAIPVTLPDAPRRFLDLLLPDGAPVEGTRFEVLDATQAPLLWRHLRQGHVSGFVPAASRLWCHANDGRVALVRPIPEPEGSVVRIDVAGSRRTIRLPALDEVVGAAPVLAPTFGTPRVVWGPSMSDVGDGPATHAPEVAFSRRGDVLVSPELDVVETSWSIRSRNSEEDLRILADLAESGETSAESSAPRVVRVHRGTGSVALHLVDGSSPAHPFAVTLARRGGAYSQRRLVRAGETVTWSRLACGAFLLMVERESGPVSCPGDPRVQQFDDVRRVTLAPGEHTNIELRLDGAGPSAALGASRR